MGKKSDAQDALTAADAAGAGAHGFQDGAALDGFQESVVLALVARELDGFIEALDRTAILETVRTGSCGVGRGERILKI